MKALNATQRKQAGQITQAQARKLLEAAEQVIWKMSHSGWKCSHDETIVPNGVTRQDATSRMLQAAINEIRGE
jgi:hypothetical protein